MLDDRFQEKELCRELPQALVQALWDFHADNKWVIRQKAQRVLLTFRSCLTDAVYLHWVTAHTEDHTFHIKSMSPQPPADIEIRLCNMKTTTRARFRADSEMLELKAAVLNKGTERTFWWLKFFPSVVSTPHVAALLPPLPPLLFQTQPLLCPAAGLLLARCGTSCGQANLVSCNGYAHSNRQPPAARVTRWTGLQMGSIASA